MRYLVCKVDILERKAHGESIIQKVDPLGNMNVFSKVNSDLLIRVTFEMCPVSAAAGKAKVVPTVMCAMSE